MIGFVCIMHKCKECERNSFKTIDKLIGSLYTHCKKDFILYLFDNASDQKYNVPNYVRIKYNYIKDQFKRGLAGPYNDGIRMAINDGCDLIILINDDVVLNDTINLFIDKIKNHKFNKIGLYGPLSNGLHRNSHQLANKKGKGIREITKEKGQFRNINGFLMAFTPEFYHNFKLSNGDFCDMRKIWSGGEEILQDRARKNGGRMFIIKDCWVHHTRISGWSRIEKWRK